MIHRASAANSFEFVRVASLRAAQLMNGSVPRVPVRRTPVLTAQLEVASGEVTAIPRESPHAVAAPRPLLDPVPRVRR